MLSRRKVVKVVIPVLFLLFTIIVFWSQVRVYIRDGIYLVRPIWDRPGRHPENVIPHFYAEGLTVEHMCKLHNWTPCHPSKIPAVFDAVIFSIETDFLEIRLKELWAVVDKFIVIESNLTFTGKPKPLFLAQEWERFKWAEKKLIYHSFHGLASHLPAGETPFYNEIKMRQQMSAIINSMAEIHTGDIIIESDIDEVPSAKTITLLKACKGYPDGLHLEMRNFLYSFEFYTNRENWKPHITICKGQYVSYHHQWSSNYVLADAGWHCSFCFRKLSQFVFKMLSYSHTDRVTSEELLLKKNIQHKICIGEDIFDMYPEAYTFKDLISKMGSIPRTETTMNVPEYVVQNSHKFMYLLPGGCVREDSQEK